MLETVDKSMFYVLQSSTSVLDSAIRKKNQTVYGLSYSSLDTGNITRTVGRLSKTSVIASANLKWGERAHEPHTSSATKVV